MRSRAAAGGLCWALALTAVAGCGRADRAPEASGAPAPRFAAEVAVVDVAPMDRPAPLGTTVAVEGYEVTVEEVSEAADVGEAASATTTAAVTVTNATVDRVDPARDLSFALTAPNGAASRHYDCDTALGPDALFDGRHLYPGGSASGLVCFEAGGSLGGDPSEVLVMVTGVEEPLAPEATSFWAT